MMKKKKIKEPLMRVKILKCESSFSSTYMMRGRAWSKVKEPANVTVHKKEVLALVFLDTLRILERSILNLKGTTKKNFYGNV